MTRKKVKVEVDIHEPDDLIGSLWSHDDTEELGRTNKYAGDVSIGDIGFERKTISDYISSMQTDRFDEQLRKMNETYEISYVLIDGDLSATESPFMSDMHPASIRGHMASLTARDKYNVKAVIPCSNNALLADIAIRLARKHIEEPSRSYVLDPDIEQGSTTKRMYACIDGVGPDTAGKLEQEYHTIQELVINATYENLQEIDGIGEKLAMDIIESIT